MAPETKTEHLGTGTARIEDAPDDDGVEIILPDEITEILELEDGDPVEVTIELNDDGSLTLAGGLPDTDLTDEQRQALRDALDPAQA